MRRIATAGALASFCLGCVPGPGSPGFGPVYTYNALTCVQLQEEAVIVSVSALAARGLPPRGVPRADPSALLAVPWPDLSGVTSAQGERLRAQMEALERTSRAKSCAIRIDRPGSARP